MYSKDGEQDRLTLLILSNPEAGSEVIPLKSDTQFTLTCMPRYVISLCFGVRWSKNYKTILICWILIYVRRHVRVWSWSLRHGNIKEGGHHLWGL
jgi:hypothetical protein